MFFEVDRLGDAICTDPAAIPRFWRRLASLRLGSAWLVAGNRCLSKHHLSTSMHFNKSKAHWWTRDERCRSCCHQARVALRWQLFFGAQESIRLEMPWEIQNHFSFRVGIHWNSPTEPSPVQWRLETRDGTKRQQSGGWNMVKTMFFLKMYQFFDPRILRHTNPSCSFKRHGGFGSKRHLRCWTTTLAERWLRQRLADGRLREVNDARERERDPCGKWKLADWKSRKIMKE